MRCVIGTDDICHQYTHVAAKRAPWPRTETKHKRVKVNNVNVFPTAMQKAKTTKTPCG